MKKFICCAFITMQLLAMNVFADTNSGVMLNITRGNSDNFNGFAEIRISSMGAPIQLYKNAPSIAVIKYHDSNIISGKFVESVSGGSNIYPLRLDATCDLTKIMSGGNLILEVEEIFKGSGPAKLSCHK